MDRKSVYKCSRMVLIQLYVSIKNLYPPMFKVVVLLIVPYMIADDIPKEGNVENTLQNPIPNTIQNKEYKTEKSTQEA